MSHTADPDTFQPEAQDERDDGADGAGVALAPELPFGVKVVAAFLAIDGLERGVELVVWALQDRSSVLTSSPYAGFFPLMANGLWVFLHLLLAALVLLGTWWGRMWTQAILTIHLVFVVNELVSANPELWLYMGSGGRLRLLATLLIDMTIVLYLATPTARRALRR